MVKPLDSYILHIDSGRTHIKMAGRRITYCGELIKADGDWTFGDRVHSAGLASCGTCRDGWIDKHGRMNERG